MRDTLHECKGAILACSKDKLIHRNLEEVNDCDGITLACDGDKQIQLELVRRKLV